MNRVTDKCHANSKLPELVDLFLLRPLVTVPLGAKLLKVTPKAVDLMLVQLGGPCRASSTDAPATALGASYEART
jgi:HTH DNA binding domain